MFPKSPVKGYFRATKSGPRIVKKGGGVYLTFHPEISFKRGCFFLSLWTSENFEKGVINHLCLLNLKIIDIEKLIKSRDQIPEIRPTASIP